MGPAAANHLWQSTACVAGAWLLTLALRRNQARVRHAVWVAASIKFLVPFSVLMAAGNLLPHARRPVAPVVVSAMDVVEEPFADAGLQVAPAAVHVATLRERVEAELPVGLFAVWVAGAAVVLLVWGTRWRAVRRIRREAKRVDEGREWEILRRVEGGASTRLGKGKYGDSGAALQNDDAQRDVRGIELRMSAERMEPGVFGVWRPVLVWPRALSARLDDAHIEAIVAHELAHVRRRDNLTAALHMLVETVFWFHPAVWWMERRMVKEREQACDEAVVEASRSRLDRTDLCDLEENKWGDSSPVRLGYASLRAQNDKLDPWGLDPTHRSAMNGARIRGGGLPPQRSLDGAPRDCSTPPVPLRGTDGAPEHSSSPLIAQERPMNGPPATSQTRDVGQPATYAEVYAEALLKTCRFCVESPLKCVAGVTGADLKQRVVEIVTGRALVRMSWAKKALVASAAMCVVAAPVVLGQAKAAQRLMLAVVKVAPKPVQSAAKAMMEVVDTPGTGEIAEVQGPGVPAENAAADDMSLGPEFEVASIRPANPDLQRPSQPFVTASGRFTAQSTTVEGLAWVAYTDWSVNSGKEQVASEGPAWLTKERFDVEAKLTDAQMSGWKGLSDRQRIERVQPMVRRLLADHFHLQVHTEQRETQAYALVVAKSGLKLRQVTPGSPAENEEASAEVNQKMRDSIAHKTSPPPGGFYMTGEEFSGTALPIKTLVGEIWAQSRLDAPLVNLTGLDGYYSFSMKMSLDKNGPSFPDQVEQGLGLKIEPRKLPLTYYVITGADRPSVDGAEVQAAQNASAAGASAADYVPTMTFDVASVRESKPDASGWTRVSGGFLPLDSSHLHLENFSFMNLVAMAYPVEFHQIVGMPRPFYVTTFNVEAKSDAAADARLAKLTREQVRLEQRHMMQAMLAERFHLKVHWETRDAQTYDLVVSKPGRLHTTGDAPSETMVKAFGDRPIPPVLQQGGSASGFEYFGYGATANDIARMLTGQFGRPVNDKTGLTGKYYFHLKTWQIRASDRKDDETNPWPPLESAIQDDLGLKLVASHGPVQYLVIDHIEMPSEN